MLTRSLRQTPNGESVSLHLLHLHTHEQGGDGAHVVCSLVCAHPCMPSPVSEVSSGPLEQVKEPLLKGDWN